MSWISYLEALKGEYIKLCKLEFLQPDGSVAFAIDNNPLNARSKAFIQDGNLTANLQNGQRRTASVILSNLDGEYDYNVNNLWFGQQIRLSMGLILPDGTDYYLPQGVFYVKDPEELREPNNKSARLTLADKWAYLDGTLFGNLDGTYEIPVDTELFPALDALLALDRGNGQPIDNVPAIYTNYYNDKTVTLPDGQVVTMTVAPYTIRIDSGSGTYADVVLEINSILAGWIGYDSTGTLRLDPSQDDILDISKPVLWEFTPTEKQFLGSTYQTKNTQVYNDIIILGESLDEYKQVAGRATNFDPSSDTNVNIIGKKTYRTASSGYYTEKQCQDLATFYLKRMSVVQKSVTIRSAQMFHLVENQLVTIRRLDKQGTPIERHLVNGYSLPLTQTGEMTIQATSVQDFPIATITPLPGE